MLTVVGARPQFIKASAVSLAIANHNGRFSAYDDFATATQIDDIIIHTGQHYDFNMSQVFFDGLFIPQPKINLDVRSGPHGVQTGVMLQGLEPIFQREKPDIVLVYGDTNSTLAGALVASKLHIPIVHVESGVRLYDRSVPEETNRVLTDHMADLLFCSSRVGVNNLAKEGITKGVYDVGDVMLDIMQRTPICDGRVKFGVEPKSYYLATIHRPDNTDDVSRLKAILKSFEKLDKIVIFPMHPRTRKALGESLDWRNVVIVDPASYAEILWLQKNSQLVITDSGGMQKEAFWSGVPCITIQKATEWIELADGGYDFLVPDPEQIPEVAKEVSKRTFDFSQSLYGDGHAAERIVETLWKRFL